MSVRVVDDVRNGRRSSCATLVVERDAQKRGIVETPMMGEAASAGTAVNENQGHTVVPAAYFPMHQVAPVERQHSGRHGIAWRIKERVGGLRAGGVGQVFTSLKKSRSLASLGMTE